MIMDASFFIARRLRFKGHIAVTAIAISFLVMIIAVSISSGFRSEIRKGLSTISGDVQLTPPNLNVLDQTRPIEDDAAYLPVIKEIEGVEDIVPVVYRAGIVKNGSNIHGVLVKGVPGGASRVAPQVQHDSVPLAVAVPRRLCEISGLKVGDRMLTYFVGEKVKLRQFNIVSVYDAVVETDSRLVVYAEISDLQRLDGWAENQVSAMEIALRPTFRTEQKISEMTEQIGVYVNAFSAESDSPVIAVSSVSRYPQLFDWLDLIDFNVFFILLLMIIVAGFNMISGLLIMLFENISTIGLLKSIGMTDRSISKVFLSSAAVLVAKGMLAGNLLAVLFCIVQGTTHLLKLDPENYFVSYVPVHLDFLPVLIADVVAFAAILLLLLIPTLFISKVDPAETVRVK